MSFLVHNTTEFPNQPPPGHSDQCTWEICPVSRSIFRYQPIVAFAVIPLVFFGALTVGHAIMGIRYRTWPFMIAMVMGCVLEVIGYLGRLLAHDAPFNDTWYMLQICVLTFAPVFFCAAIYLSLSRIVTVYGAHISRIPPVWYTRIFITCDILSLALQGAGGGMASGATTQAGHDLGTHVMVGALCFQLFTILVFCMLGLEFAWRVRKNPDQVDMTTESLRSSFRWKGFLYAMPTSIVLIFIRCVYRVIEMSQGYNGALIQNQDTFLIFEGIVLIVATLALLVFHPGFSFKYMRELKRKSEEVNEGASLSELGENGKLMVPTV